MSSVVECVENIPTNSDITCIIPVRISSYRADVLYRLNFPLLDDNRDKNKVSFCIIDDGSPANEGAMLREACLQKQFGYIRLDTALEHTNMARARNYGAMYTKSPYIMLQDLDLMPYEGFYEDILTETELNFSDNGVNSFVMAGVIYLSQLGSREFLETPPKLRRQKFLNYLFAADEARIEKFSTGTSVTVFDRAYYLSRGGYDEEFSQWGYEDIEYNSRCMRLFRQFPYPEGWLDDYRNFSTINEYRGWKSLYRLYGDMTSAKGIVMFHHWHPVNCQSDYQSRKALNERLLAKKMKEFAARGTEPPPLPDLNRGKSLLFRDNPFVYSREFAPFLGEVVWIDEYNFRTNNEFAEFLKENSINRVIFHNPYVNKRMKKWYDYCRKRGFPYIVAERGALRGSVFFDRDGFLSDSGAYHESKWNRVLSNEEKDSVLRYIRDEKSRNDSLEIQPDRLGAKCVRRRLGLGPNEKVLFVPLQRPGDTVIGYQCGTIGTYDKFLDLVGQSLTKLGRRWRVVLKKHPLEEGVPEIEGAVFANDANVKDLLEICDAVLLINSGVGVLGMIWGKPVMVAGDAFYSHKLLNRKVTNPREVISTLNSGFKPDQETVLKFINYLINEFYSFGEFTTRPVKMDDGTPVTATTKIKFSCIRGITSERPRMLITEKPLIRYQSILFDRYRYSLENGRSNSGKKPVPGAPNRTIKQNGSGSGKHNGSGSSVEITKNQRNLYGRFGWRRVFIPVVRPFVKKMATGKSLRAFDEDPVVFFQKLRSPRHRKVGKVFFPQR